MPDERHPPDPAPDEESVRRLLAAEGATPEPVPEHVADRLERILADLAAGRPVEPHADDATVTPLPGRGRRRRLATVLVAAAAVSVVGLGVGTVVTGRQGSGESSTTARDAGGAAGSAAESRASAEGPARLTAPLPRMHRAGFSADAQRVARRHRPAPAGTRQDPQAVSPARDCRLPRLGRGDVPVAVLLDGRPATLVLRAPAGGARVAQAYLCDAPDTPAATAEVPVR